MICDRKQLSQLPLHLEQCSTDLGSDSANNISHHCGKTF